MVDCLWWWGQWQYHLGMPWSCLRAGWTWVSSWVLWLHTLLQIKFEIKSALVYLNMLGSSLLTFVFCNVKHEVLCLLAEKQICIPFCFSHLLCCSCLQSFSNVHRSMKHSPSHSPKLGMLSISKKHLALAACTVFPGMCHQLLTVCWISLVMFGKCLY